MKGSGMHEFSPTISTDFAQAVVAGLIAAVLFGFDRVYDRVHLRYWALSFLFGSLHVATTMGSLALSPAVAPDGPGRLLLGAAGQAFAYWSAAWLLLGTWAVATGRRATPELLAVLIFGLGILGVGAQLAFAGDPVPSYRRFVARTGLRSFLTGGAILTAAVALWRLPFREPSTGRRVVSVSLGLWGLEVIHYGVLAVLGLGTLPLAYTRYLEFGDLALAVAVGTGFVIWLAEEERGRGESLSEQLRQSRKMEAVGQLAGGIAHDFNNMLTVILGHYHLLAPALEPGTPERRSLEEIAKAADRGRGLTGQLLAFSRKQVLRPRTLDLNEVVQQTTSLLNRLLGEDIRLSVHLDDELGPVYADRSQIEQVVLNLAVNARDAMPRGGTLELRSEMVEREGERLVCLVVRDTGGGIPETLRDQIFEPYFTTKAKGKGTGLGLSTVYGIVTQSGGWIEVDSKVGRGSTFRVLLPRHDTPGPEPAGESPLPVEAGGSGTILLVEDEGPVRQLTARLLERAGYHVLSAADGHTALRVAEAHPGDIDLLLSDVVMPGLSGRELATVIGVHRPSIGVLLMSGYTDDAMLRHGVANERMEFIHKPFTMDELLAAVRKATETVRPG